MSFSRLIRTLMEKRRLSLALRDRKADRKARQQAALRGKVTEHRHRMARHRETWGLE